MHKFYAFRLRSFLFILFGLLVVASRGQNLGFEAPSATPPANWTAVTGTWLTSTTAGFVRTGTQSMSILDPATSGTTIGTSNPVLTTTAPGFLITIGWGKASTPSNGLYYLGYRSGTTNTLNPTTTTAGQAANLNDVSWSRIVSVSASGTLAAGSYGVSLRAFRSATSPSTIIYVDDVIMYSSASSVADLSAPSAATAGSISGTTINWTNGTDNGSPASGIGGVVILRADGAGLPAPTLNDQAMYNPVTGAAGVGSFTDGSVNWTVMANINNSSTTSFNDPTAIAGPYTYVVYMRDQAYNYSPGLPVAFAGSPCNTTPTPGQAVVTPSGSTCPGTSRALSLTGNSAGSGQTYRWLSSSTQLGTYTYISTSNSFSTLNVSPATTTWYRAEVTCSGNSVLSTPVEVLVAVPLSGTYTINPGAAASLTNFQTIGSALGAAGCGISGPVVFEISSGTYNEQLTINAIPGSSTTNTITLRPAAGNSVTITNSSATGTATITVNAGSNIIFDGLRTGGASMTLENSASLATNAVLWFASAGAGAGASNNVVRNCFVKGNAATTTLIGIGFGGLAISATSLGASNNDNLVENNTINSVQYGIYSQGASTSAKNSNNKIRGNVMVGTGATGLGRVGVLVGFEDRVEITRNTVSGISASGDVAGITLGGITISTTSTGNDVTNAIVSKNNVGSVVCTTGLSSVGIYSFGGTTGVNVIDNNVISGVIGGNTTTDLTAGIYIASTSATNTTKVYFNSVSMTGARPGTASSFSFALAIGGTSNLPTVDIQNNILFNTQTSTSATGKSHAIGTHFAGAYGSLTSRNNDLFVSGAQAVLARTGSLTGPSNGVERATLADWFAETALDAPGTSISVDPMFNSTTILQPQSGSPVVGAGIAIPGFTTDFVDITRGTPPTIGAYELALDAAGPVITYTLLTNTSSTANRTTINFATVTDVSGVNTTAGTRPRLYYKRSTDANSLGATNDNTTAGWKFVESNNASSPFDFTIDYNRLTGGTGVSANTVVQYFVVAQDLAPAPNVSINSGTFASQPSSVNLSAAAFPIAGTINSYVISVVFAGNYNVGPGQSFTSLTAANGLFAALKIGEVNGNITANITGDISIEDGTNTLTPWTETGAGNYTLTIRPTGGATRVVSGTNTTSLIALDGADRVTIDGLNAGGNSLVIRNAGASGAVIRFLNDATTDTIRNCTIEGGNTSTASGLIVFGTSTGTLGNSNNAIRNNMLTERTDGSFTSYAVGVYSSGTSTALNTNNTIEGNQLRNFTSGGVTLTATGNGAIWNILGNQMYNNQAPASTQTGISIASTTSTTVLISNNTIGGTAANGTGTWTNTGNVTVTGILLTGGVASILGNTITNISNTNVGTTARVRGIYHTSGVNDVIISGNTITNLACSGAVTGIAAGNQVAVGISNWPGATFYTSTIKGNVIENISAENTTALSTYNMAAGVFLTNFTGEFSQNRISDIKNKGTGTTAGQPPLAVGIYSRFIGTGTFVNNMISLGSTETTNTQFAGVMIVGVSASGNQSAYYHNSILVSGTGAGSIPSYGFVRGEDTTTTPIQTMDLKNNIISMTRSGGGATNYAIASKGPFAGSNWASNFNDLYNPDVAAIGYWNNAGYNLANWKTASSGDANSVSVLPIFVSPTNLHLAGASIGNVNLAGTPLPSVPIDYDNDPRNGVSPYMGADEALVSLPVAVSYFAGKRQANEHLLTWKASCSVTTTFTIERSTDGRNFSSIGSVFATPADCANPFNFTDRRPAEGINYYRLKMSNPDGRSTFSVVVALINKNTGFEIVGLNPSLVDNGLTYLNVTSTKNTTLNISITDLNGRVVAQMGKTISAGSSLHTIDVTKLANGVYQLTGTNVEGYIKTLRFVKN